MRLQGSAGGVPPVSLVFAGPLSKASQIAAIIDTGAIESYLTVRRMEEDVERLENLDVSGRNLPVEDDQPEASLQPGAEPVPPPEAKPQPDLEQEEIAPQPDPVPQPALQSDLEPASLQAPTTEAPPQPDPAAAGTIAPAAPRARSRRRPRPAPDDWKKGISIFGGF
jgi:hypothetical protein